jgi:hypothetical protein
MRVLVCGGRDFLRYLLLTASLDQLHAELAFTELLHGDAPGADQMAWRWAAAHKVPWRAFPADWARYGKAAGPMRNQQMLDEGKPSLVVAFPGGTGTEHMKRIARTAGVRVLEVSKDGSITWKVRGNYEQKNYQRNCTPD